MSFEKNDKKFERRSFGEERRFSQANTARPRFDKPRFDRPRPENVVRAIGDKDAAPQVAVGGLKEVEALLENEPLKVHRVLFMHQSKIQSSTACKNWPKRPTCMCNRWILKF
jgi:23S rRNA (guanosine2251-2'-O)-methyltransferase